MLLIVWACAHVTAQNVVVSGAHTASNGTYATLGDAFAAINSEIQNGNYISISIHASTTELATAQLNQGTWISLRIFPSTTGLAIRGHLPGPLIDLNGADRVEIDGRVGGLSTGQRHELIISNSDTSATPNASTIRFMNGAIMNSIQYARIEGSAAFPASGAIFFSTGGNDNNNISNNLMTNAGGFRPFNMIYALGSPGNENTDITIQDNDIFDFFCPAATSNGIRIEDHNAHWTISGNSFYESSLLKPNNNHGYSVIWINSLTASGMIIRGNFIGGTQLRATGAPLMKWNQSSNPFHAIRIDVGSTFVTEVDSNIIQNISWANNNGNTWSGIAVGNGWVDIGRHHGNQIGGSGADIFVSQTGGTATSNVFGMYMDGTGDIRVLNNIISQISLHTSETGSNLYGVFTNSTGQIDIDGNTISGLTTSAFGGSFSNLAANIIAIQKTATPGIVNIRGNIIGSNSSPNSLHANSPAFQHAQLVCGIQNFGTGVVHITSNIIANLTNASRSNFGSVRGIFSSDGVNHIEKNIIHDIQNDNSNTEATHLASVGGIVLTGNSTKTVIGNTIHHLRNTSIDFTGHLYGIYFSGDTSPINGVFRNFIYDLEAPNNWGNAAANVYGIRLVTSDMAMVVNNIVSLEGSHTMLLHGLYNDGIAGASHFYHNTVYLGGTASAGSAASFAMWSNASAGFQNYRNNIFVNERSGGVGTHFVIRLEGNSSLIIDDNLYRVSAGGVLGLLNSGRVTLSDWQAATLQDQGSINLDPQFILAGGTSAMDYLPQNLDPSMRGSVLPLILDDYQTNARVDFAKGALEYKMAIWWVGGNGTQPKDWGNAGNWYPPKIPDATDIIWMEPNGNGHHLILDQNRKIYQLDFLGSGKMVELGQYNLVLQGDFFNANENNFVQTNGTGKLIRHLADQESFHFPVGKYEYNPVSMTNRTGMADTFSVRVFDGLYSNGFNGLSLGSHHVKVTWDISKGNGTAAAGQGVDFTFQWKSNQETFGLSNYHLNHFNGIFWEIPTDMGAPNLTGAQVKELMVPQYRESYSLFGIGEDAAVPLPITLSSFTADCTDDGVQLEWVTTSEINQAWFHVEESVDLMQWNHIASIKGVGQSNMPLTYHWKDLRSQFGTIYYRLAQEDFDGTKTYFTPLSLRCEGENNLQMALFPNPAKDYFYLQWTGIPLDGFWEVTLSDMQGRVWLSQIVEWTEGTETTAIQIAELPAAVYQVNVTKEGEQGFTFKLVVP